MGVDAGSDARAERRRWRAAARALPPVLVLRAGEDAALPLPKGVRGHAWRVALEGGETLAGSAGASKPRDPRTASCSRHLCPPAITARAGAAGRRSPRLAPGRGPRALPHSSGPRHRALLGISVRVRGLKGFAGPRQRRPRDLAAFAGAAGGGYFSGLDRCTPSSQAHRRTAAPTPPRSRRFLNWICVAPDLVPEVAEARGCAPPSTPRARRISPRRCRARRLPGRGARRRRLLEAASPPSASGLTSHATAARPRLPRLHARDGQGAGRRRHLRGAARGGAGGEERLRPGGSGRKAARDPASSDGPNLRASAGRPRNLLLLAGWLAEGQPRRRRQGRAKAAGMRIGLYRDLAVGVERGGLAHLVLPRRRGPRRLGRHTPTSSTPRAELSWHRLGDGARCPRASSPGSPATSAPPCAAPRRAAWTPRSASSTCCSMPTGAKGRRQHYVRYPFDTMAAILALESHRRCLVHGGGPRHRPDRSAPVLKRASSPGLRRAPLSARRPAASCRPSPNPRALVSAHDLRPRADSTSTTSTGAERTRAVDKEAARRGARPTGPRTTAARRPRPAPRRPARHDDPTPRRSRSPSTTWPRQQICICPGAARGCPNWRPAAGTYQAPIDGAELAPPRRPRPRRRPGLALRRRLFEALRGTAPVARPRAPPTACTPVTASVSHRPKDLTYLGAARHQPPLPRAAFKKRQAGSTHGYDVADATRARPDARRHGGLRGPQPAAYGSTASG